MNRSHRVAQTLFPIDTHADTRPRPAEYIEELDPNAQDGTAFFKGLTIALGITLVGYAGGIAAIDFGFWMGWLS